MDGRPSARRPHGRRWMTGTIKTLRLEKGFGFIKDERGQEYFFHRSAVYGEGLEDLREGDRVEFEVGQGAKGFSLIFDDGGGDSWCAASRERRDVLERT